MECTVGYHASAGFTGDQLFPVVWEATRVLESIGFKVRNWVRDGAAPNRRFFLINGLEEEKRGRQYWTVNSYAPKRKIFFISDVPHLLKTTRNNLENSHGNNNTRNLHVSGLHCYYYNVSFYCYSGAQYLVNFHLKFEGSGITILKLTSLFQTVFVFKCGIYSSFDDVESIN